MDTPPFNWTPPEWVGTKPDLKTDPGSTPFRQANAPVFNNPDLPKGPGGIPKLNGGIDMQPRINTLIANTTVSNTHFVASRALEQQAGNDVGATLTEIPHPHSKFNHVDPGFHGAPIVAAIGGLKGLKGSASLDGEADEAFKKALPALENLEEMLGSNPKGMQRLKLVSDNTLVRAIMLMGEMNVALAKPGNTGKNDYTTARNEYIDLLKDLDDREPNNVSAGTKGYGRCIQWAYVAPIIHAADGKIKGARVMAKWNPHISSSGIPIPH